MAEVGHVEQKVITPQRSSFETHAKHIEKSVSNPNFGKTNASVGAVIDRAATLVMTGTDASAVTAEKVVVRNSLDLIAGKMQDNPKIALKAQDVIWQRMINFLPDDLADVDDESRAAAANEIQVAVELGLLGTDDQPTPLGKQVAEYCRVMGITIDVHQRKFGTVPITPGEEIVDEEIVSNPTLLSQAERDELIQEHNSKLSEGLKDAYAVGVEKGIDQGYKRGFEAGRADGFGAGKVEGILVAQREGGRPSGEREDRAYRLGLENGKQEGLAKGIEQGRAAERNLLMPQLETATTRVNILTQQVEHDSKYFRAAIREGVYHDRQGMNTIPDLYEQLDRLRNQATYRYQEYEGSIRAATRTAQAESERAAGLARELERRGAEVTEERIQHDRDVAGLSAQINIISQDAQRLSLDLRTQTEANIQLKGEVRQLQDELVIAREKAALLQAELDELKNPPPPPGRLA